MRQLTGGTTGKARDGTSPVPVLLLTAALGAAGVAGARLAEDLVGAAAPSWPTMLSFLVLLTAAGFPTLQFHYRDEVDALDLFEAVLAPAVFVLPPLLVVAVVGVAKALSQGLQRINWIKACFNVAQWMSAAATGSLVFQLLRDGAALSLGNLLALVAAMLAVSLVNLLALVAVLLIASRQRPAVVLAKLSPAVVRGSLVGWAINVAFGVIFLATATWLPQAMLLWLVPLGVLHYATRAYSSVRADRARLAGLQRATHALGVPIDPRDAVPDFLAEVRRCFESEVAELVVVLEDRRVVHRSREGADGPERRV